MKIIIDTHNCSREELSELKEYLEENCWDFKTEGKEENEDEDETPLYVLGEDSINGIEINEKIRDEELFDYKIIDRKEFIDDLINWISEAKGSDKILMKEDLEMLLSVEDDYIFSSISTNEYITKSDLNFNNTCKELLELNESL